MLRRWQLTLLAALAVVPFGVGEASALGLGVYGGGQFGAAEWDVDDVTEIDPNVSGLFDFETDGSFAGLRFGFVLDTAPAQDRLFNYRLNVGAALLSADWDTVDFGNVSFDTGDEMHLAGIVTEHTFGFGVLREGIVRLWVGPRVRVGFYGGELEDGEIDEAVRDSIDIALFEFGVAPTVGANVNIGRVITLGVTGGYMISGFAGVIGDLGNDDTDITGTGFEGFVDGVLMFRLGADAR